MSKTIPSQPQAFEPEFIAGLKSIFEEKIVFNQVLGLKITALALAHQLAAFPQATLRADRASALAAEGVPLQQALLQEWAGGRECLAEALRGASRFAAGQGRHGEF